MTGHLQNGTDATPAILHSESCTEALDTSDADEAFRDLIQTTRDPLAAAVLVAGLLVAEAIRGTR